MSDNNKQSVADDEGVVSQNESADITENEDTIIETSIETQDNSDSKIQEELDNLRNQLLRAHADFDNFRKRTRQEKEDLQQYATRKLLEDLLPIVDNFDRALQSLDGESEVKTGIEMVHRQLLATLDKYGVRGMDVMGEAFNPNFHEAVMQEPADDKEVGVITAELQKGYMIHEKVLRPAMVRVTV